MAEDNRISDRADPTRPFVGRSSSPPLPSPTLSYPPFTLSAKKWPPSEATKSGERCKLSPVGLGAKPRPEKYFGIVLLSSKELCLVQPLWFLLREPECPSEVSEAKWASFQTRLRDGTY